MKSLSLFLAFTLAVFSANAQTSKEILDKLSAKAKTWKSINAEFSSTLNDPKTGKNIKQDGTIKIKGKKYALDLPDYKIIADGVTIWTFDKKGNTCSIDNLEDVKDGSFDPSEMFTIWEKDFNHEMKNANATMDGVSCFEINLFPKNPKGKSFHTITMYVDKNKMEVKKIVVKTKENSTITYSVKTFKTTVEVPDSDFVFDKSKFPGVKMNDNRI